MSRPRLPAAPHAIRKGSSFSDLLEREAIDCLVHNITLVHPDFDGKGFQRTALNGLKSLSILRRGHSASISQVGMNTPLEFFLSH